MVRPCCNRRTIDSGGKCAREGPARLGLDLIKPEPQRSIYGSCLGSWQIHERNFARSPGASRLPEQIRQNGNAVCSHKTLPAKGGQHVRDRTRRAAEAPRKVPDAMRYVWLE